MAPIKITCEEFRDLAITRNVAGYKAARKVVMERLDTFDVPTSPQAKFPLVISRRAVKAFIMDLVNLCDELVEKAEKLDSICNAEEDEDLQEYGELEEALEAVEDDLLLLELPTEEWEMLW